MRSKDRGWTIRACQISEQPSQNEKFQYSGYHLLRPITTWRRNLNPIMECRPQDLRLKEKAEVIWTVLSKGWGIQVGDQVIDKTSKQKLKVVAFMKNAKYLTRWLYQLETYTGMRRKTDQAMLWPKPLWPEKNIPSSDLANNLMVADRNRWSIKSLATKAQTWHTDDHVGVLSLPLLSLGFLLYPHPCKKLETVRRAWRLLACP